MMTGSANKKLLFLIFLFFIIIFVIVFFNSSLSKVSSVDIEGNRFLTDEQVLGASEVEQGDSFFSLDDSRIKQRVRQLELASAVEVKKRFPGRITISVKEYPHVAFEWVNGRLHAVLANGSHVAISDQPKELDKPILTGWTSYETLKKSLCQELSAIPKEFTADISEITPSPTEAYADRILFYSRSSYEVITTIGKLAEKLSYFHKIVEKLQQDDIMTGRIIMLEADLHQPFEEPAPAE